MSEIEFYDNDPHHAVHENQLILQFIYHGKKWKYWNLNQNQKVMYQEFNF